DRIRLTLDSQSKSRKRTQRKILPDTCCNFTQCVSQQMSRQACLERADLLYCHTYQWRPPQKPMPETCFCLADVQSQLSAGLTPLLLFARTAGPQPFHLLLGQLWVHHASPQRLAITDQPSSLMKGTRYWSSVRMYVAGQKVAKASCGSSPLSQCPI